MKHLTFMSCAAIVIVAFVCDGAAQTQPRRKGRPDQYEVTAKISESNRYISTQPEKALAILRTLDTQFPRNELILTRIGFVMQVVGEADSAEVYYRKTLDVNPRNLDAGKSLGTLLMTAEKESEAGRVFDTLIESNGHHMNAYRVVGNALRDLGRLDAALDILKQGRDRSPQHMALTLEIATLQKTQGNFAGALDEYLLYIGEKRRNYRYTRAKILDLMREAEESLGDLTAELERRLDSGQGDGFVFADLLSAHYLERGLLESSLELALRADGQRRSDGSVLLDLAEMIIIQAEIHPRSGRHRYLDLGARALDAFAKNHPKAAGTDRALYMTATIYAELGSNAPSSTAEERIARFDRALDTYSDLSRRYPNSEYAEIAYLDRGNILLHDLKRPEKALEVYRMGAINARREAEAFAEAISGVYIGLGRFDDAKKYIEGLTVSNVPELRRTGYFFVGLLFCMTGNYSAARDTLTALAENDPSSPYANDAIETAWIVEEALVNQSKALDAFMGARQAELVGDTTAVVRRLESIVKLPVYETLRPRAMVMLARVLDESGEFDGAVAVLERFLKEYPEHVLRPEVQRHLATVYEFGYEQYERALAAYETVLVDYPEYAFLDEVRRDVRRLRFIVVGEEYEN